MQPKIRRKRKAKEEGEKQRDVGGNQKASELKGYGFESSVLLSLEVKRKLPTF